MGKATRGESTRTPFGRYRQLILLIVLLWLAVPSMAQNNGYFIVTPTPGSNAVLQSPGTAVPQDYALYGDPSASTTDSPGLPTALQLNVPVGTGIVHYQDNPSSVFTVNFVFIYPGPSVTYDYSYSISGGAPWVVIESPPDEVNHTGSGNLACDNSQIQQPCYTGANVQAHIDATGLPVGNYVTTFTFSGFYFGGSFQIALNVLPSGVTAPYIPPPPPSRPAGPERRSKDGDPVDLSTGLLIYSKTDLVLNDVLPVRMTRTYRQPDFGVSRAFGIGATHPYDMFLWNFSSGFSEMDLVLPDGQRIHYVRTSSGTGYSSATLQAQEAPGEYFKSTITWNGLGWNLTLKDGTVYAFGQNAPLQSIQDRHGNRIAVARDGAGNITKITSPSGRWIQFTNDSNNRITQLVDNIGRTVIYTYDSNGFLSSVRDANGGTTSYTYDASGNMLTITDPRGIVYLTNQYDSQRRVTLQTQADNSNFQFAYVTDANNKITQTTVTDPRSNVRQVTFGANGYTLTDTLALGKPEQQTTNYNRQSGSNLLLSFTDALNRQTSYSYDAMGNVTNITRLAGTANAVTTLFSYEPTFNQVASITDPLNHATSFIYDTQGNLTTVTDPLNHQTTFTYNSAGQALTVTDALQNTSRFGFAQGDLVSVTDPVGRTINRFLDGAGRVVQLTDANGKNTRYVNNSLNQITSVTDPLGNGTTFSYDPNGNVLSVTDPNNHATQYTYDNMDRLATRKDALLNQESYQYDLDGNLSQFTDRRGKVAIFNYDGLNRLTFAGYGMTAGPAYESTVSYTYDSGNRLTQAVDSLTGTITRGYDGVNRLTSETTGSNTVGYSYDAAGRRASLTVPGQALINYTFDNANRLTQIGQGSATVGFTYDVANRRSVLTLPNGVTASYSYDNASQLTALTYAKGSTTLGNLTYGYDLAGRRINVGGSFARTGLPLPVNQTAYNANNQLTTWGTANLFYDLNGNMTSSGTDGYTWDARNRMVSTLSGANFQYDAFGRRTSKTIGGTTTSFLYDGANPVQEVIGGTNTANSLSGGIDEIFQRTDSAGARGFLTDALGSTLALTDSSGTLQTQYTFEPFGNTSASGSATTNSFAYTGRELDAGNLYFYRARYYNPALQRFLSEDPLGLAGGINAYSYAEGDPIDYADPSGTDKKQSFEGCVKETANKYSVKNIFHLPDNFLVDAFTSNTVSDAIEIGEELGGNQTIIAAADAGKTAAEQATGVTLEAAAEAAPNLAVGVVIVDGAQRITSTTIAANASGIAISRASTTVITGSAALTTTRAIAKGISKALVIKDLFDFGVGGLAATYCAAQ